MFHQAGRYVYDGLSGLDEQNRSSLGLIFIARQWCQPE